MTACGYSRAVEALRRALVFGINPSLDGIRALSAELGDPHAAYDSVQITGTNGKTSTARLTHALLKAHGRAAALYTSPELERINERMELGDGPVPDEEFARAVCAALDAAQRLRPGLEGTDGGFTEFELTTAAALWLFRALHADVAVLEVGMGGRWDATSVVSPAVAVVTGVGLDHTAILGDSLEKIAAEKAAIIKPGCVAVLGPGTAAVDEVFLTQAAQARVRCIAVRSEGDDSPVPEPSTVRFEVRARPGSPGGFTTLDVRGLLGEYPGLKLRAPAYQAANVATAIAAAESALGGALDADRIRNALEQVRLPGRFELVHADPPVVVDGSHNPQAAAVLARAIEDAWPDSARRPVAVVGMLADKDARSFVAALGPVVSGLIVTEPVSSRALPAADLAAIVAQTDGRRPQEAPTVAMAVEAAIAAGANGVVVTGSLTTAGQAREYVRHFGNGSSTVGA